METRNLSPIDIKIGQMYELAYRQEGLVQQELLDFAGSISNYGKGVADNIKLLNKCMALETTFIGNIKGMVSNGLKYSSGDYYIFIQKGGSLKITKSPNGSAKVIDRVIASKDVKATLVVGIVRDGDEVSMETKGTIQTLSVNRGKNSIFNREGAVSGGYGIVTVFSKKTNDMLSRNVIIVDKAEYNAIENMASKTMETYESMLMNKIILRRYAQLLPAFVGGGFTEDDMAVLDEVREGSRVDKDNVPPPPPKKELENNRTKKDVLALSKKFKDKEAFIKACEELGFKEDKDMMLSDILVALTDEEYADFTKKLFEGKGEENV